MHDPKALKTYGELKEFFRVVEENPAEAKCKEVVKRMATTSASGNLLNALRKEDKLERRKGCKAVVNQQKSAGLPLRACLLERAKKAISMN